MELKKSLGIFSLTVYGVGNMLGAGIYGLVGRAAGEMGNAVWMSFLVSMLAAGFTGLSYASLGSRFPKAGGAAFITYKAFNSSLLAYVVGLAVITSGLTSMAASLQVFSGYFISAATLTDTLTARFFIILSLLSILGIINFIGLREAAWFNTLCTLVEVAGLFLVIFVGFKYWGNVNYLDMTSTSNPSGDFSLSILLACSVLTFYAFIGFEDLLNVSEEVKDVQRVFPIALISALVIAAIVYMSICITVVSVIPHTELTKSPAPLSNVIAVAAPWFNTKLFSLIALFAVTNTALLNYIMGSRLLYGMSTQGLLPKFLGHLHPTRATPHAAILTIAGVVLILILSGDIKDLSKATSILLLISFTMVNLSLFVLQRKSINEKQGFTVPSVIPIAGMCICIVMIFTEIVNAIKTEETQSIKIAGLIFGVIMVLYFITKAEDK